MKKFDIPAQYRSSIIGGIKEWRKKQDPRKKDFSPVRLDFGSVNVLIPRHMGFCYGVENAIEISYKAITENPEKRIFLLSQMIHNPAVNEDLESRGITFILDTEGRQLQPWEMIQSGDIVIIPAFGTTVEIEQMLLAKGVEIEKYNTTCPFVEKVWKRSAEIGSIGYTVVIHGKYKHEETRATFSHSKQNAPSIIIRDMREAVLLSDAVTGAMSESEFYSTFEGKLSEDFNFKEDLKQLGVVNQTTMLATETQEIADYLKTAVTGKYGASGFADTRDTLCYATNDNQTATLEVLNHEADFAIVVGGYNSSNTAQLVTILERKMPVYYVKDASELLSKDEIQHFDYPNQKLVITRDWLTDKSQPTLIITSGASCPDPIVEGVLNRVLSFFESSKSIESVLEVVMSA